jgi:hypothetical protein
MRAKVPKSRNGLTTEICQTFYLHEKNVGDRNFIAQEALLYDGLI